MGEHIRHGAFEEVLYSRLGPNDTLDSSEKGLITLVVIGDPRIAAGTCMEGAEVPIFRKIDTFKPVREFILALEPPLGQHNFHYSAIEDTPVSNLGEHSNVISSRLNVRRLLQFPTVLHHTAIDMDVAVDNELSTGGLGGISQRFGMVHSNCRNGYVGKSQTSCDLNAENSASQGWCPSERAKAWRSGTGFLDT
jgi:hypothetical protein